MIRDHLKDQDYFAQYITAQKKRIKKFEGTLNVLRSRPDSFAQEKQCISYLVYFYKNLITAMYSIGNKKNEIQECFSKYIAFLSDYEIKSYTELIDVLSLTILLEVEQSAVIKIPYNTEWNDPLIQILRNQIGDVSETNRSELAYPEYYAEFLDYAIGKISMTSFINFISQKWYASCSDCYWYESHTSKEAVYAGYWCWLAAALIKIKGENAESVMYIPTDII